MGRTVALVFRAEQRQKAAPHHPMIRMAGQNLLGPVDLFSQAKPGRRRCVARSSGPKEEGVELKWPWAQAAVFRMAIAAPPIKKAQF